MTRSTLLSTPICRALSVGPAHGIRRTVAALLVDHDEQRRLAARGRCGLQLRDRRDQRRLRRDVEAEQDDAADLAPPDAPEQAGARGRAVHADDELLTDELGKGGARRVVVVAVAVAGPASPGHDQGEGEQRAGNRLRNAARFMLTRGISLGRQPSRRLRPVARDVTSPRRLPRHVGRRAKAPIAFARQGSASHDGAGPQSICRGRNVDGPRIRWSWLPSVRIRYRLYSPSRSSRNTMYLPSGEYEPTFARTGPS